MRVALVSSSYHPYPGGVEEHVRHVAREQQEQGHDVVVWTVDRGERLGRQVVDGVEVHYLPCPLPARDGAALARLARALPAALHDWWSAYRASRPEVLHVQCFGPNGVYALALHRLTRTPLVVTSHGETVADDHGAYDESALLRASLRAAVGRARAVTAPSECVLRDLRERFGLEGGQVVPNGVTPFAPRAEPVARVATGRRVLAVGRVERMKGFDLLLHAVAATGRVDVEVVLVGEGAALDELRAQADRLGIGDRVRLLGRLPGEEVAAQMAAADVVVVPSRQEAFGIVALEAWRAGTPLVATTRGGMAEFVSEGEDGLLVDPTDTAALAAAITRVLDDRGLAERLAAAGSRRVRDYTWPAVARRYVALYGV